MANLIASAAANSLLAFEAADVNGVPSFIFRPKPIAMAIARMYGRRIDALVQPMGERMRNALRLARQRADRAKGRR